MHSEQSERFETIRRLVDDAQSTLDSMRSLAESRLETVDTSSSDQASCLQELQQQAGTAVQALTEAANVARHARSYQAQHHDRAN